MRTPRRALSWWRPVIARLSIPDVLAVIRNAEFEPYGNAAQQSCSLPPEGSVRRPAAQACPRWPTGAETHVVPLITSDGAAVPVACPMPW
jgi:hypothetical protein